MATIADLQRAANKFSQSAEVGFTPIACDGVAGPATLSAVTMGLAFVSADDAGVVDNDTKGAATRLYYAVNAPSDLGSNIDDIIGVLNRGAEFYGYADVGCPSVASTPKQPVTPTVAPTTTRAQAAVNLYSQKQSQTSNFSAGLFGLGLPNWAVYGGGAVIALGIIGAIVHGVRMRRARLPAKT